MDLKNIVLIFTFLANSLLAYLSYFRSQKTKANLAWSVVVGTVMLWIASMIFYRSVGPESSLFWCRILYVSAVFIPAALLYFIYLFPEGKWTIGKTSRILIAVPGLIIIFLVAFSDVILKDVIIRPGQEKEIVWGAGYFLYAFYISGYFTLVLWKLFKKYLKSFGTLKIQLRYMLIGLGASILFGCAFNLIMPWLGDFRFNWLGQITTFFMVGFISYAISRYRLMDIRVILTELLVASIAFFLLAEAVLYSKTFYEALLRGGLFLVFCFFSYLLIKSVLNEIKRREELERLTKELRKTQEQLKKLDKAKSEFLSIASHQLRTPLSVIKGYISMILENTYGKVSRKMQKPLKNIYTSNQRLIKLINTLLDVSRIEAGKTEVEPEKTSLEDVISSVVDELKIEAKKKNLYLRWERPRTSLPEILIDREKIRDAILNVVDNAIRYTNHGGITIETKIQDTKYQIRISDTGKGMAKEELSGLFKSFARGAAGTQLFTEGAGLGLYVAKKFIEMHNGRIWAESSGRDRGSKFYIELPIHPVKSRKAGIATQLFNGVNPVK